MPTLSRNAKSEKRGAIHEKSDTKYPDIHFLFFAFHDRFSVFRDKCTAGLRVAIYYTEASPKNLRKINNDKNTIRVTRQYRETSPKN